jgi:hypothetical protein
MSSIDSNNQEEINKYLTNAKNNKSSYFGNLFSNVSWPSLPSMPTSFSSLFTSSPPTTSQSMSSSGEGGRRRKKSNKKNIKRSLRKTRNRRRHHRSS